MPERVCWFKSSPQQIIAFETENCEPRENDGPFLVLTVTLCVTLFLPQPPSIWKAPADSCKQMIVPASRFRSRLRERLVGDAEPPEAKPDSMAEACRCRIQGRSPARQCLFSNFCFCPVRGSALMEPVTDGHG